MKHETYSFFFLFTFFMLQVFFLLQVPDNNPALGLAAGMVKAWELYGNPQYV
jgi:hypothetical protein